jgi:hypothetical protein
LGVYYGETCKANKQSLLQAIGLEEEGACLNDRTWYLKSADRNYSENKVQAQYFEAVPKRDHAAYQGPQPASGCPVSPLLRNRGAQADTNAMEVSSTSGANEAGGTLGGEVGAPEAPMETGYEEESDADAATSTPGGGHSTASAATTLCDDASAPAAADSDSVASADTTTAAYALSATAAAALRQKEFIDGFMDRILLPIWQAQQSGNG